MKQVTLVQIGYQEPIAFAKKSDALAWVRESGYLYKTSGTPYYWTDRKDAKSMDGDTESRAWVTTVTVN
jgi:hypothetical protein